MFLRWWLRRCHGIRWFEFSLFPKWTPDVRCGAPVAALRTSSSVKRNDGWCAEVACKVGCCELRFGSTLWEGLEKCSVELLVLLWLDMFAIELAFVSALQLFWAHNL